MKWLQLGGRPLPVTLIMPSAIEVRHVNGPPIRYALLPGILTLISTVNLAHFQTEFGPASPYQGIHCPVHLFSYLVTSVDFFRFDRFHCA